MTERQRLDQVVAVALAILVTLGSAALAAEPAHWRTKAEPFHLAGPIYYVGTEGLAVYLFKTDAGLILLSGGMPGSDGDITASIEMLGFRLKDIKLLLMPHAHTDHAGTMAAMKRRTGADLAVLSADVSLLKSGGKEDYLFGARPDMHFPSVAADHELVDGETITLGGMTLKAHWTPGHTRGCTTWTTTILVDAKSYNVAFADCTSVNPGTRLVNDPSYPGIADDYRRTFKVLSALNPDIFLSYHAEFFGMPDKRKRMKSEGIRAWVDPNGYAELIARKQAEFEGLVAMEKASKPDK